MRKRFVEFDRVTWFGRRWFFRYRAENGETVFQSEAYNSAAARDRGIEAARQCHDAPVVKGV